MNIEKPIALITGASSGIGEATARRHGRILNIGSVQGFLPMPYGALYAATKHALAGYSESLDHELRTTGIRVCVIEPAYTKTQFDANFLAPDSTLDEYGEVRALLDKVLGKVMATADEPGVVADTVLEAASATRPKATPLADSPSVCDGCADLRRLDGSMPGSARICGSTRCRRRRGAIFPTQGNRRAL